MSRDISKGSNILQAFWIELSILYSKRYPEKRLFLTHVDRTIKEQQDLFAKGRTKPGRIVTNCDGLIIKSDHNYTPSRAIDVAVKVIKTGKVLWGVKHYTCLGELKTITGFDNEVYWGGDFKSFKDYPHFGLKTIYYTWINRGIRRSRQ